MAMVRNPKSSPYSPPPSPLTSLRPPPSPLTSLRPPPISSNFELCIGEDTFNLTQKIGSGSFGVIYLASNIETNEKVAIKLENSKTKYSSLAREERCLRILEGGTGIPSVRCLGMHGDYNGLVMDFLGPSLGTLFTFCDRKFSLKTVLKIGIQMIDRIEYVHGKSLLHRDIKPENFLIGLRKSHLVYLIDFGLAKRYKDRSNKHILYRDGKSLVGTSRYVSINTHLGIEQSRRDDLEAVGYVLIYFLIGRLPWQGLKGETKQETYNEIKKVKLSTSIEELCRGQPKEFEYYVKYCRKLRFDEKPNYSYLKAILHDRFVTEGFHYDDEYDWSEVRSAFE